MARVSNTAFEWTTFFEKTPDLVCIAGKDGYFRKVNPAVIEKLGYTEKELFARPIASFIYPEDRHLTSEKRKALLNGTPLINFQNRYVTKKGSIIWLHWSSIYFPDKEVVFALAKDVTERKEIEIGIAEQYKKFKSLATHFKNSIEKDRKYIAMELHEELAQLASVVKIDIDCLRHDLGVLPDSAKSRMEHASAVAQLLIDAIRRISFSISPNMLDDMGLNESLKWLCSEFSILNRIPCTFESSCNDERLPYEVKLDVFRICQQSLNDIMCHAQATCIKIHTKAIDEGICLYITHNDSRVDPGQIQQLQELNSLKRRVASINGRLTVKRSVRKGTKVCVVIPRRFDERE